MSTFKTVARIGDIPPGEGRAYEVEGRMVAVFFVDEEYRAIDDFCPHMGASLAGGAVEDGIVFCPWHAWRFRVCDGTWCDNPVISVDTFEVRIAGDEIQVSTSSKNAQQPNSKDTG
jgi:nitrite reductase (NADH) small subunit/3-phenylpropionate/trans-cinnamate dioxygenase ferredoxin subunit